MRYLLFGLCMLAASVRLSAQPTAGLRLTSIRIGALALLDPYNPGAEVTIERQVNAESSVQFSAAYLRDFFHRTPYQNFSGARFVIAKKWVFHSSNFHRWYGGLESGASVTSYVTRGRFAVPNADGQVSLFYREYHESFTVQKQTAFVGGRIGVQGAVHRLAYDASVGLGVKYKRTQHLGRQFSNGVLFPGFIQLDPYQIADRRMNGLVGNMPIALSVGYTF